MFLLIEAEDDTGPLTIALRDGQPLFAYPGLLVKRCRVAEDLSELWIVGPVARWGSWPLVLADS